MQPFEFDLTKQYGDYIYLMPSQWAPKAVEEAKALLMIRQIARFIPHKYHKRIKWIVNAPDPREVGEFAYGTVSWKVGPIKKGGK
jgi:hypothetical protein